MLKTNVKEYATVLQIDPGLQRWPQVVTAHRRSMGNHVKMTAP